MQFWNGLLQAEVEQDRRDRRQGGVDQEREVEFDQGWEIGIQRAVVEI